jgi:hypothetical protein
MYREYTFLPCFLNSISVNFNFYFLMIVFIVSSLIFAACYFGMGWIVTSNGLTIQNDVDIALIYRTKEQ